MLCLRELITSLPKLIKDGSNIVNSCLNSSQYAAMTYWEFSLFKDSFNFGGLLTFFSPKESIATFRTNFECHSGVCSEMLDPPGKAVFRKYRVK